MKDMKDDVEEEVVEPEPEPEPEAPFLDETEVPAAEVVDEEPKGRGKGKRKAAKTKKPKEPKPKKPAKPKKPGMHLF